MPKADFRCERRLRAVGYRHIVGVDEVGRGPLAGPVVAAAVILPETLRGRWVRLVQDSKALTPRQREVAYAGLQGAALDFGVGIISPAIVDAEGILTATRYAMGEAIRALRDAPDALLVDGPLRLPGFPCHQEALVKGDARCRSIAAASIIAKVTRDRLMEEEDARHPAYGFAAHKGYATPAHLARLREHGPSRIHRTSFAPVWQALQPRLWPAAPAAAGPSVLD